MSALDSMSLTELIVTSDREVFAQVAADWIIEHVHDVIAQRGHCHVALAGGSTPQPVHAKLLEADWDWSKVTFYFGDERCVEPEDPDSNFGMAQAALFEPLAKRGGQLPTVQRMRAENKDRQAAAREYEELLPQSMDLLILGMGDDGHILSLFPGSDSIDETEKCVLAVRGPKAPFERITFGPKVVAEAQHVLMLEIGSNKAEATQRALEGAWDPSETPAQLARKGTWIVDHGAARLLTATTKDTAHMSEQLCEFGIIGLGTMGSNLALNVAENFGPVAVWNLETERTREFVAESGGLPVVPHETLENFVAGLAKPRRVLLMITAGRPVDIVSSNLKPLLDKGDVIIDGGNSRFTDTQRRVEELAESGLHFVGMGVSGGADGARLGPSMMPGGPAEAYEPVRPIVEAIAAKNDLGSCVSYIGRGGAGHFVKMVHNGIEYADMQLIAEAYDLMKRALGMDAAAQAKVFAEWNRGPLESFLIEITAEIMTVADPKGGSDALVEAVLDRAGQKGTGRWTAQEALELGVPIPAIAAAIDARSLSSRKQDRVELAKLYGFAETVSSKDGLGDNPLQQLHDALHAGKICAYAQGFHLIQSASEDYDWDIQLAELARIWTGGCIIRARFLNDVMKAFGREAKLSQLLFDTDFRDRIQATEDSLRAVVRWAQACRIPVPALAASLAYLDSYRTHALPQNLTQAQRDAFGAHTYQRKDDPSGSSHNTDWLKD